MSKPTGEPKQRGRKPKRGECIPISIRMKVDILEKLKRLVELKGEKWNRTFVIENLIEKEFELTKK